MGCRRYIAPAARLRVTVGHQRAGPAGRAIEKQLAIHNPLLDAVVAALHMRNTVAPTVLGKAAGPEIRRLLDMIIDADDAVFQLHGTPSSVGFRRHPRRSDPVDAQRVFVEQLPPVLGRDAINHALDGFPGARIERSDVGEIRLPYNVVDADMVTQLDAFGFKPKVHVHLTAHGLARTRGDALRPQMAALPFVIAGSEHIVKSTDAGLGKHALQTREA